MTDSTALNASPTTLLSSVKGEIVGARLAYPEVLHLEIRDPNGGLWRLATQDAQFIPTDPSTLIGSTLKRLAIDPITVELRGSLANGSELVIRPDGSSTAGDPPSWELLTPDGLALEFGPGLRWQISPADAPVAST